MALVRVVTAINPENLLRHAAAGFLVPRTASQSVPFPTVDYLLCLRQGGLRDDVIRMAGEAGVHGWFDTPMCTFQELPARLGVAQRPAIGEYERVVLLSAILRRIDGPLARVTCAGGFVADVDTLFGELIGETVGADELEAALRSRSTRDSFEVARDAALATAYRTYNDALAALGRVDGRDQLCHTADCIASNTADLSAALKGRRQIRIFGLADMRGGWRRLLQALATSSALDEIVVYTSATLDLGGAAVKHDMLDELPTLAASLFSESSARGTLGAQPDMSGGPRLDGGHSAKLQAVQIIAPDVERELDTAATRIRALVDGGTLPTRIAVVTRRARPHVDQTIRALAKVGVPATARQRVALHETSVVRALSSLLSAASEGWTRHGLTQILRHPYIGCGVDPRVLDYIGYRHRVTGLAGWTRSLKELQLQSDAATEAQTARRPGAAGSSGGDAGEPARVRLPVAASIRRTRECFASFAARAEELDRPKTISAWLTWLEGFLQDEAWGVTQRIQQVPGERFDVVRRDMAACAATMKAIREWRTAMARTTAAVNESEDLITVGQFARELAPCLETDLILWTPTAHGVPVLEAPAAAYRAFDHVFVVGMEAGAFPSAPPKSPIWDDEDRDALRQAGLPLDDPNAWETREQELFRVVVAGARTSVTFSHSRLDMAGHEVLGSAFVEEVAEVTPLEIVEIPAFQVSVPGVPLYRAATAPAQAEHATRVELIRSGRHVSAYNGGITDPGLLAWLADAFGDDKHWSPSQLEEFAKCPWAYLSKRLLRLERFQDPDEDMDPSMRGTLLHDALARFYKSAAARVEGPVFLLTDDWIWAEAVLDGSLDDALLAQQNSWLGHPTLRAAKRSELRRLLHAFVRWEMDLHHDMTDPKTRKRNAPKMVRTGVTEHELSFDGMVFERDGVRIRYRGTIDRVEVSVDERVPGVKLIAAADYKTTGDSTPGGGSKDAWGDGVVLQVPLYAYALAKLRPDHEIARVEYLTLKRPGSVHSLQLYTVDKKTRVLESNDDAVAQWQTALDWAVAHVKQARRGEFPAAPPASCGCPPWCHGRDICRIPRNTTAT